MGLLDDIKKLRARAESLNNNLGKSKKVEQTKPSFEFNTKKTELQIKRKKTRNP